MSGPVEHDATAGARHASEPSDGDLLARHLTGDTGAFGELVRRHRDRLWAVALRTLGDREEAADALQDALVSAFRSAHTFQGRSAVTTWLHRIVVNACLDRARRAAVRRTSPIEDGDRLEALVDPEESADVPVVRGELRRELARALASLPADQRAALVLVDMQGYPVAEAAAVLGVPAGTVKSRCARGRARLLPLLGHLRAVDEPADVSRGTPRSRQSADGDPGRPASTGTGAAAGDKPRRAGGRNLPTGGAVKGTNSTALPGDMTTGGGATPG